MGRDKGCTLQITGDDLVSRQHARVRFEKTDGRYHLIDLNSENGTYINDEQIKSEVILDDYDIIGVGDSTLVFSHEKLSNTKNLQDRIKRRGEEDKDTLKRKNT
ncbi:MAG: FHA domain-containing protein [Phycisphaerales bacterium]|nr:FHA domain-containing protein [Phycisphaerales bacterium]